MNGREREGWSWRFVPSWTRWLAVGWTLLPLAWLLFPDVPFNPSDPYTMSSGWRLVIAAWYLVGVCAQIYRYARASGPVERQQTKWVVYGVTVAVLGWTAYTQAPDILPVLERPGMTRVLYQLVGGPIFACALLLIPLSLMVAILRYRLFDIDVVVNRTLVYGSLTAVLALVYLGSVVLLQGTFLALTGQEPYRPGVAARRGGLDLDDRRAVQPFAPSSAGARGSPLLSPQVRRRQDPPGVLDQARARDEPRPGGRRIGGCGQGDDAAHPRLALAAPPSRSERGYSSEEPRG